MKLSIANMSWGILLAFLITTTPLSFFKYERPIHPANTAGQHYFVVDETIWEHARPDLDDLRLYIAERVIPYALTIEMGNRETEQKRLRVLQPGSVGGKTQFLLDMAAADEYDRIQLTLETKNFVAHGRADGQDDPHGNQWVNLGTTTIYDLTDEKLGHNSTLQIPLSAYRYLRVTLDGIVKPSEVMEATAGATRSEKAVWRDVAKLSASEERGRDTVLRFEVPPNVSAERVLFTMEASQPNFLRSLEIQDSKKQTFSAGTISRIHTQRRGQKIDVDNLSLATSVAGPGTYRLVIHNGDDAPLKISDARLQQYERRIYFDAEFGATAQLYYGDERLTSPVYDYHKLFQKDANATPLTLGAETMNVSYTGRPDDRPWSERHPAVLWAAIIAVVLLLGGIAFRSVKSATS